MVTSQHTVRLAQASYDLLLQEATRRGIAPDALADELLRTDLGPTAGDLDGALSNLAELRAQLPDIDGVTLARDARAELEHRGA
jgi:hypothetical protein